MILKLRMTELDGLLVISICEHSHSSPELIFKYGLTFDHPNLSTTSDTQREDTQPCKKSHLCIVSTWDQLNLAGLIGSWAECHGPLTSAIIISTGCIYRHSNQTVAWPPAGHSHYTEYWIMDTKQSLQWGEDSCRCVSRSDSSLADELNHICKENVLEPV